MQGSSDSSTSSGVRREAKTTTSGTVIPLRMPSCRAGLTVTDLGSEILVYDPRTRGAHRLAGVIAVVFRLADGKCSYSEAVTSVARSIGKRLRGADELVRNALAALAAKDLLEPGWRFDSSRRAFVGAAGKLGLAVPLISSVFAPTPAAAVSIVGGVPAVLSRDPGMSTEAYDYRADNPFRSVRMHPVSTFAVDVDTASYSNVRRFLRSGQLPPADAVRVEEMINYFRYSDSEPSGEEVPLAVTAELSRCPWELDHSLLRLGISAPRIDDSEFPPRNLVFLLDVSGSMNSPDKLPLVRSAMRLLVETLGPGDSLAMVVYAGAAGLVLDPTAGSNASEILAALDRLEAGGSTNGGEGISLAYAVAGRMATPGSANRVILATDGDFNVGVSSRGELIRLIEREKQRGVFLSVLGFGTGNLKDSAMEQLADRGNGNYSYIDSLAEARRVLVQEAGATLHTVARDVKLQVEWNPLEVSAYRLIGYENRLLSRQDFEDDSKDGGEVGAGHHVTALYELVELGDTNDRRPELRPLRYQSETPLAGAASSGELGVLQIRSQPPEGGKSDLISLPLNRFDIEMPSARSSADFRLAAGVAMFGMLLRDSPYRGNATYEMASAIVATGLDDDRGGYRAELIELIAEASDMSSEWWSA